MSDQKGRAMRGLCRLQRGELACELDNTQDVPIRIFEPGDASASRGVPDCARIRFIHAGVARKAHAHGAEPINGLFDVWYAPAEDGEWLRVQLLDSGHAQHRPMRVKLQRKRLLVGDKAQPQNTLIERTSFRGIGGGSEGYHFAPAED